MNTPSSAPMAMEGPAARSVPPAPRALVDDEEQLRLALQLSQQDAEAAAEQQRQEEEELERILQLSLTDKWC